jgi:hypothetical protein
MNLYELSEPQLDCWVARALGHEPRLVGGCEIIDWNRPGTKVTGCRFQPSADPKHGEPIIEREGITTIRMFGFSDNGEHTWQASHPKLKGSRGGPTELKASMRAYVAAIYGDELPDEVA